MKKLVAGILAHVDAGKTTLSEGMLYLTGGIRSLGRVDHGDTFLDTNALERARGITIFSKQANLQLGDTLLQLLDTPGHVDFSAEMERTLQVLDVAILVISGPEGVQSHTRTLWNLLTHYQVPTLIFCNKMDLAGADKAQVMQQLRDKLNDDCVDFSVDRTRTDFFESVAVCDEQVLTQVLETGNVSDAEIADLVMQRKLFPVFFGSALLTQGVQELLDGIRTFTKLPEHRAEFGARVYKITRDERGNRLSHVKITGGSLAVRQMIGAEKVSQIRIYSGTKYTTEDQVEAGTVCALAGLENTVAGQGLGAETDAEAPLLMPVLSYQVLPADGTDKHTLLTHFRQLEEEDPELKVLWDERHQEIHVQLMGEIQLEVLKSLMQDRFGVPVTFGAGAIVYKETLAGPVEGIGHFEPLRHYAEVHLLMEPGEAGSGLTFDTVVREDDLDLNWQRLILTHLAEKTHLGVLTGSPITDMKITLVAGRAHIKHTEGGDFRQATYRAVRNGLMKAENVLLEPVYRFHLEVPTDQVGRAMNDIRLRNGSFEAPETFDQMSVLEGKAPVSEMTGYTSEVMAYTGGRGRLVCNLAGYMPCHNAEAVIENYHYDAEADLENTADSVFCSHGAGFVVPWYEVEDYAHLETLQQAGAAEDDGLSAGELKRLERLGRQQREREERFFVSQDEIDEIMTRTYGRSKRLDQRREEARKRIYGTGNADTIPAKPEKEYVYKPVERKEEYLLVDGYNIIFAWEDLNELSKTNLDAARQSLIREMDNYQEFVKCNLILVFDAYRVKGHNAEITRFNGIDVVYTKEAETADSYIEKTAHRLAKNNRVRVASSDGLEQVIIMGAGALRISAREFRAEVEDVKQQIRGLIGE